jgi:hypothetical protein
MKTHIDFLRLGSWNWEAYPKTLSDLMEHWPGEWKQKHWLQYKGWQKEGFFIGHGLQNGRRHHIISISGNLAHKTYKSLIGRNYWYATRIDLQVTLLRPNDVSLPEVHARVGKIKSTLITSEKNDTLYLGTRTNPFFTRLYEKPLGQMYLRLEFELKGHRAKDAWLALGHGRAPNEIFQYYLTKVKLPDDIKKYYEDAEWDTTELASRAEIDTDNQKILDWLYSLDKAMYRHMSNHDIGEQVGEIIMSWANFAKAIDYDQENS